jgi:hypothetical protein
LKGIAEPSIFLTGSLPCKPRPLGRGALLLLALNNLHPMKLINTVESQK